MEVVARESADLVLISNKCLFRGWKGDCHQSKTFCFCECLLHRISISKGKAIVLILFVDQQVAMMSYVPCGEPCPARVLEQLQHLAAPFPWVLLDLDTLLRPGTMVLTASSNRTCMKRVLRSILRQGGRWPGQDCPSQILARQMGKQGLYPCREDEVCVYFEF